MNILAFCLPILLFTYWNVVGYATLSVLRSQRNIMQNILIAPAIGIAVTLLAIFFLSRSGMPVENFAGVLTLTLFIASIVILKFKKPYFPMRRYLPFAALIFLALCLTGWPLLKFGFDWVSYSNDDMGNYCLSAFRFLHHGYSDVPNIKNFSSDYSLNYWFLYVPDMSRSGADLYLAWASALTHLTPIQIFMSVIIAFNMTLVSVSTALIYISKRWYYPAITTCALICFSPLTTLGVEYQLIAQVLGLSLLIANGILLMQLFTGLKLKSSLCLSGLIAIMLTALLISYPELFPFIALTTLTFYGINFLKGWRPNNSFYLTLGIAALLCIVILNIYIINIIYFIHAQESNNLGTLNVQNALFPFYLLPSGLANLWGILPVASFPSEPWLSLSIFIGALLLFITVFSMFWFMRKQSRLHPVIAIVFIMLSVGVYLFIKNADFALYKLAMYLQPFILGTLALAICHYFPKQKFQFISVGVLILLSIHAQNFYVDKSLAIRMGGFAEIPLASNSKINLELMNLVSSLPKTQAIILDTPNNSLAKLQALYLRGRTTEFLANDYFDFTNFKNKFLVLFPDLNKANNELKQQVEDRYISANFNLHNAKDPTLVNEFSQRRISINEINNAAVVMTSPQQSIFNRREFLNTNKINFMVKPANQVSNHLIFINSQKGLHYFTRDPYGTDPALIGFSHLEGDYYFNGKSFATVGQYLLFQIINPQPKSRVELNITTTLNADGNNSLPHAAVIGNKRTSFPLMGRGSAHVFSEPVTPQIINQFPYINIDMEQKGNRFPYVKKGLINLYNKQVLLDRRREVTFARDISLISDAQYNQLKAPNSVSYFPLDLGNPNLEYSGIYEDGWISENAFFKLTQQNPQAKLTIKGLLPSFNNDTAPSYLTILVNGKKLATQKIIPGNFEISYNVPYSKQSQKVELHFTKVTSLPGDDKRPAAAKIDFIGFGKLG